MSFLLFGIAPACLLLGCQSSGYNAKTLPRDLRVNKPPQSSKINLSGATVATKDYQILGPGDLVDVTLHSGRDGEDPHEATVEVSETGEIDLPIVGPVNIAGRRPLEAGQNIAAAAQQRGIYRQPNVKVEIASKAVVRVTVLGAVTEPGVHELPRTGSDLVNALAIAGGMTEDAGVTVEITRRPSLLRAAQSPQASNKNGVQLAGYQSAHQAHDSVGRPATTRIDLSQESSLGNFQLNEGDAVLVLPREKELIYVTGLVSEPGQFELPRDQEVRLLDAIAMAGDTSSPVADKVLILRRMQPDAEPTPIIASIAAAKKDSNVNLRLTSGDTVTIERTPATVVVDTVGKFFRVSMGLASRATVF
ncbi:SLBB domain-containing protein [Adhaeretor mobilis]|uniref:SLBB domain-containing protein n=1 Tax=Adhaeretor mobilis TaxID=1930276 RepID=UPI001C54F5EA|nr:polysaccharide biosynthesis/export family protein [Adhaeretor mobilis]